MNPSAVLVGVTFMWGTTFLVTKDIVSESPPFTYIMLRFGLAALVLVPWCWSRIRRAGPGLWRDATLLAVLNTVGLSFQVLGQAYTSASKSSFVTSLNTPLTPLVGYLFYRTRPSLRQLGALGLATFGVWLLTYPTDGAAFNRGDLLTLACAGIYATVIVELARRTPRHDALALTAAQLVVTVVVCAAMLGLSRAAVAWVPAHQLPPALALEGRPWIWSPRIVAELIYMAVVCTVLTFSVQNWAMARMSAVAAAIIFSLEPVFATGMAALYDASEWPGLRGAVGAGLVIAGAIGSIAPRQEEA